MLYGDDGAGDDGDADARTIRRPGALPTTLGRYRILRRIGEGGMGAVYLAQQDNPSRTVALKVISAAFVTPELLRRFEHEAQVLGRLQHPGIAQIFEADRIETDAGPQPFFAMEYIRGVSITEYADRNGLGTRQRLDLLAKVCDAIEHAHQRGVIHRDLKPANILVDESGQPKILDFGVARATDADVQAATMRTDIGQLVGTLPYMSPEQASGDPDEIDTRSDVYALGVVAYELLTGRLPYDVRQRMIHEAVRVIREDDPTPLSSVNRVFRGDVETIVGKALEKPKPRRYQSAAALASDIRRYLGDQPIEARPQSTWYQFAKFARRNKAWAAGAAAVFLALVGGLIATGVAAGEAIRQRDRARAAQTRAELEASTSERVVEFMVDMFEQSDPGATPGEDLTARQILDRGAERIETDLADEPAVQARLQMVMGDVYTRVGLWQPALAMLEPALETRRNLDGVTDDELSMSLRYLSRAAEMGGDLERAEATMNESIELYLRTSTEESIGYAHRLTALARIAHNGGDYEEARRRYDRVIEIYDAVDAPPERVASALHNAASVRLSLGAHAEAEQLLREAVDIYTKTGERRTPPVAKSLSLLGIALREQGRYDEALDMMKEAYDIGGEVFERGTVHQTFLMNNYALALKSEGRFEEAEAIFRELLEIDRETLGAEHPYVAFDLDNLADVIGRRGEMERALELSTEALELRRRVLPEDHPDTLSSMHNVAWTYNALGRYDEAEQLYVETYEARRRVLGDDHPLTGLTQRNLAGVYRRTGRVDQAIAIYEESLAALRERVGDEHKDTVYALASLARAYEEAGRHDEARALYEEGLEARTRLFGADHIDTISAVYSLAQLDLHTGALRDAEPRLRDVLAYRVEHLGALHPDTIDVVISMALLCARSDRVDEGEQLLLDAHERVVADVGPTHARAHELTEQVAVYYARAGRADEAERWLARLPEELRTRIELPAPE